ncbi:MAG: hypothetical protein WBE26_06680 [Phycisphaerae bacterium]
MVRLEAHVKRKLVERVDRPALVFVDLPEQLTEPALGDLREAVSDLLAGDWTDEHLCREMATRLGEVGWMAEVDFVRRTGDGQFKISGRYRLPVAMVQKDDEFILVDGEGVRLPGTYLYTPTWKLIQGVGTPAPKPGAKWDGADIKAGLAIVAAMEHEVFGAQITAVIVENVGGRRDPRHSHIELATDRAGGRIRWGSAPGSELEENTVEQKLAILRENYRQTGRVDAHHPVIDISIRPDRFTVPG